MSLRVRILEEVLRGRCGDMHHRTQGFRIVARCTVANRDIIDSGLDDLAEKSTETYGPIMGAQSTFVTVLHALKIRYCP